MKPKSPLVSGPTHPDCLWDTVRVVSRAGTRGTRSRQHGAQNSGSAARQTLRVCTPAGNPEAAQDHALSSEKPGGSRQPCGRAQPSAWHTVNVILLIAIPVIHTFLPGRFWLCRLGGSSVLYDEPLCPRLWFASSWG